VDNCRRRAERWRNRPDRSKAPPQPRLRDSRDWINNFGNNFNSELENAPQSRAAINPATAPAFGTGSEGGILNSAQNQNTPEINNVPLNSDGSQTNSGAQSAGSQSPYGWVTNGPGIEQVTVVATRIPTISYINTLAPGGSEQAPYVGGNTGTGGTNGVQVAQLSPGGAIAAGAGTLACIVAEPCGTIEAGAAAIGIILMANPAGDKPTGNDLNVNPGADTGGTPQGPDDPNLGNLKALSSAQLQQAAQQDGYDSVEEWKTQELQLDSRSNIVKDNQGNLYSVPRQGTGAPQSLGINLNR
jgi:hypothetical protein